MKFFVLKKLSKKSGKEYIALCAADVFGVMFLSFDQQIILRISGLSVHDLANLQVNEQIDIGYLEYNI